MVFIIITLIKTALIAFVLLTTLAYLQWVERNRGAMASYDAFVEREGLLLEDLRTF